VFVLQYFERGVTARQLTEMLGNEMSLSKAYMLFFRQMGWIDGETTEEWHLSKRGKETLKYLRESEETSITDGQQ
jgi:hypothetical protein